MEYPGADRQKTDFYPKGTRALQLYDSAVAEEILNAGAVQELQDLTEYANKFHHDTNAAWETETINDGELKGFVQRSLKFTSPPQ